MKIYHEPKKQRELVLSFFQLQAKEKKPIAVKQLVEFSGSSSATIKSLIEKEVFVEYFINQDRVVFEKENDSHFTLSEPQKKSF